MQTKRFTKNDGGFICKHCGLKVEPLGYTSRNHCPACLWSVHLDEMPGDRKSLCMGEMEPIGAETDAKKGYIIIHRCTKCGCIRRNKTAHEAIVQPDDIKKIIELTVKN
ncbi:MAG: RNHCP domain-containing protein [Oscillospiraceae bacterium]|nr:RNHCP domain-containing protein [Oscillospiraceae bacterium]